MKRYKIIDWAGNILDFKGRFKLPQLAVAMAFDSFDTGWDYILENMTEDQHDDLYVEEL